jgi:hypothetical protein
MRGIVKQKLDEQDLCKRRFIFEILDFKMKNYLERKEKLQKKFFFIFSFLKVSNIVRE